MSFPVQNLETLAAIKNRQNSEPSFDWEFAEIWVDPWISPPYILMLVKDESNHFCIYNPAKNYQIVFTSDNYETAQMWLLEDEYERVTGRILPEK